MRKWFELMQQHLDANSDDNNFIENNLFSQTQCVRDWIDLGNWEIDHTSKEFSAEQYSKDISDDATLGVDRQTIAEWINDPEYAKMMRLVATGGYVKFDDNIKAQWIEQVKDIFPIDWSTANIVLAAQRPGEMFPLHYDRPKNNEGSWSGGEVTRWVIMLYDRQPGQCFFMNNHDVPWKAGDVLGWNHSKYHHGSANFGYYPRFSIRLTAEVIECDNKNLEINKKVN